MLEEIEDGDRKVVVGRQQSCAPGDDPVPVVVGVAGEGEVEAILQLDQSLHRIRRRRVHADLAVPIDRHEPEGRVDGLVDDGEVQPVAIGDRPPVVDTGAAEGIDAEVDPCAADGVHVDHIGQIGNVGIEVVMPMGRGGEQRLLGRDPLHALQATFEKRVRPGFDPVGDGAFRRPAARRVVLEAAVVGRIVRRGDHDAVGEPGLAPAVVREDGVGHDRGRGVLVSRRGHDLHPVGRQHLQGAGKSRDGKCVRVHAEEQRPVDLLLRAVQADRLTDGENVPLVEGLLERRSAMSRGAERHALPRYGGIGPLRVVGGDQPRHVDEHRRLRGLSRERANLHRCACTARGRCVRRCPAPRGAQRNGRRWSGSRTPPHFHARLPSVGRRRSPSDAAGQRPHPAPRTSRPH